MRLIAVTALAILCPLACAGEFEHEGKAFDGLRLELSCKIIPIDYSDVDKLEFSFTFINESNKELLVSGYLLSRHVGVSRLAPLDAFEVSEDHEPPFCKPPLPTEKDLIRLPPGGRETRTSWNYTSGLGTSYGASVDGKLVDKNVSQSFTLKKAALATVAFGFRCDGQHGLEERVSALAKDQKLWSGRVYSNPITIEFAAPFKETPIPPDFTGHWVSHFRNGKKHWEGEVKAGKLDGLQIVYGMNEKKNCERYYKNGKLNGTQKCFAPDGKLESQTEFEDDRVIDPKK